MTTSPSTTGGSGSSNSVCDGGARPASSGRGSTDSWSSSIAKASTSVGPFTPRKRSFNPAIVTSSTKVNESSESTGARSSVIVRHARRDHRGRSTRISDCSSATNTVIEPRRRSYGGRRAPCFLGQLVTLVRVDDVLHDSVAHHVVGVQLDERQIGNAIEDLAHHQEPRAPATFGEVDLGDVASDHDLRTEAETGEKHRRLLGRGVLRFVEDDERVVESAATHERERRDLNGAALQESTHHFRLEHVVQRVIERSEIRINLGEDVTREKSQPLACLHRGTSEDDAMDLLRLERLHRERDREIALARPRRPHAESDGVGTHRVDVALLTRGLGPDRLTAPEDLGGEHLGRALVGLEHLDAATDALTVEHVPRFEQRHHLLEQVSDALGFDNIAADGDLVAPYVDRDGERILDETQELIALAEQADHQVVARYEELDLGRRRRSHVGPSVAGLCPPDAENAGRRRQVEKRSRVSRWGERAGPARRAERRDRRG